MGCSSRTLLGATKTIRKKSASALNIVIIVSEVENRTTDVATHTVSLTQKWTQNFMTLSCPKVFLMQSSFDSLPADLISSVRSYHKLLTWQRMKSVILNLVLFFFFFVLFCTQISPAFIDLSNNILFSLIVFFVIVFFLSLLVLHFR